MCILSQSEGVTRETLMLVSCWLRYEITQSQHGHTFSGFIGVEVSVRDNAGTLAALDSDNADNRLANVSYPLQISTIADSPE